MQIREIKPVNFLYHRAETRISALHDFLWERLPEQVQQEAISQGMRITGPVYWNYFGFSGDPEQTFTLEIAVPVAELNENYQGRFKTRRAEAFRCVTARHDGDWMKIPETYALLMQYLQQNGLAYKAENRELYINADFTYPEANITEIQIGIH